MSLAICVATLVPFVSFTIVSAHCNALDGPLASTYLPSTVTRAACTSGSFKHLLKSGIARSLNPFQESEPDRALLPEPAHIAAILPSGEDA